MGDHNHNENNGYAHKREHLYSTFDQCENRIEDKISKMSISQDTPPSNEQPLQVTKRWTDIVNQRAIAEELKKRQQAAPETGHVPIAADTENETEYLDQEVGQQEENTKVVNQPTPPSRWKEKVAMFWKRKKKPAPPKEVQEHLETQTEPVQDLEKIDAETTPENETSTQDVVLHQDTSTHTEASEGLKPQSIAEEEYRETQAVDPSGEETPIAQPGMDNPPIAELQEDPLSRAEEDISDPVELEKIFLEEQRTINLEKVAAALREMEKPRWVAVDQAAIRQQRLERKRLEEERRRLEAERLEQERLAEEARIAEEKRLEEERLEQERLAEEARIAEEKRLEEERLEQERLAEEERIAEEKRLEEERLEQERLAEEERIAEEKRLEQERLTEEERIAEEKRLEEERLEQERLAEEERIAEEKRLEEERLEQERLAEEERIAEEKRLEEERLEQERLAEEARIAEEKRLEEERLEQERLAEEERIAEEKRLEEERLEQERLAEEERIAEEKCLEEERLEQERLAEEARIAEEERLKEERLAEARLAKEQLIEDELRLERERLAQIDEEKQELELEAEKFEHTEPGQPVSFEEDDPSPEEEESAFIEEDETPLDEEPVLDELVQDPAVTEFLDAFEEENPATETQVFDPTTIPDIKDIVIPDVDAEDTIPLEAFHDEPLHFQEHVVSEPAVALTPGESILPQQGFPPVTSIRHSLLFFIAAVIAFGVQLIFLNGNLTIIDYSVVIALGLMSLLTINLSFTRTLIVAIVLMIAYLVGTLINFFIYDGAFTVFQLGWFVVIPLFLISASNLMARVKNLFVYNGKPLNTTQEDDEIQKES
ncbi:MAG: hypothetical protein GX127_09070 [Eubacteriaceae bacterium]|jgi:hypothetical protein|nr:hypothetical protein [Eubacteriaceae bacterium]